MSSTVLLPFPQNDGDDIVFNAISGHVHVLVHVLIQTVITFMIVKSYMELSCIFWPIKDYTFRLIERTFATFVVNEKCL